MRQRPSTSLRRGASNSMAEEHLPRFLLLDDVAEELTTSKAQIYAMVRSGDLPAIKVGGRGQWRVERANLEEYIARAYVSSGERDDPIEE
jgi:excisionase family DNA binding protein